MSTPNAIRDNAPAPHFGCVLGRMGKLEARIATNSSQVRAALALRHRIFCEPHGPVGSSASAPVDEDRFDAHCAHLLIVDPSLDDTVVGTCRLLDGSGAARAGGYYTEGEFELTAALKDQRNRALEVGRSCIDPSYRSKRTAELLWQGIWAHVRKTRTQLLFGCASFDGCSPASHQDALGWLNEHAPKNDAGPLSGTETRALADFPFGEGSQTRAFASLPPLLKGYLRLGASVSRHLVFDRTFNTTDVCVLLETGAINPRYIRHYGEDASRFAS